MKSVPNFITTLRLLLVPLFVVLLMKPTDMFRYMAAGVFIFAALTDFLDGAIARKYGAVSNFGKLFDPLADKLLVMSALVMLVGMKLDQYGLPCQPGDNCILSQSWVAPWMVILILGRELWVTGIRAIAADRGEVMAATSGGKLKSFLQMLAIPLILIHDIELAIPFSAVNTTCYIVGLYLLFFSLIVAYWSAIEYSLGVFGASLGAGKELSTDSAVKTENTTN